MDESGRKHGTLSDIDLDITEELLQNLSKKHWKVDIAALPKTEIVKQVNRKDTPENEPIGKETMEIIDTYRKKNTTAHASTNKNEGGFVGKPTYREIEDDDGKIELRYEEDEERVFVVVDKTNVKETDDDIEEHSTSLPLMGASTNKKKIISKIFKPIAMAYSFFFFSFVYISEPHIINKICTKYRHHKLQKNN